MILDALEGYGFHRPLSEAGFLATDTIKRLFTRIKGLALSHGSLIVISGSVGAGKTTFVNQLMKELKEEKKCLVSYSFSSDRQQVNIKTLLTALHIDLSKSDKPLKVASSPEIRDRNLVKLLEVTNKPVVLFIDEAQDLHGNTLSSLKKLSEIAKTSHQTLSIILSGQPKLRQAIRLPKMEEIGSRAYVLDLDEQRAIPQKEQYLQWAIIQCLSQDRRLSDVITPDALKFLTDTMSTPLQIISHFNRALEIGFVNGMRPIDMRIMEMVIKSSSVTPDSRKERVEVRPVARVIEPVRVS
jgi:type II secretory pathway predicted ATPase ExeA